MVLLIQMKKKPHQGRWAFPGGLIESDETTLDAAKRILETQAQVRGVYLEQLATFDSLKRDPLDRVVSVAYFALIPPTSIELETTDRYADIRWWPANKLPHLAYDHSVIAKTAIQRLRYKLEYTNVAWSLLPPEFSLTELQKVYEIILGQKFDKRNFRKRVLALGLIAPTGKTRRGQSHRPAALYRFRDKKLMILDVL